MVCPTSGALFERISNEIGGAAACNFAAAFGHKQKLYVPKDTDDENHVIRTFIGARGFSDLVQAFGGEFLDVPDILAALRPLRRASLVHELRAAGASVKVIAAAIGTTPAQVHRILRSLADRTPLPEFDNTEIHHATAAA